MSSATATRIDDAQARYDELISTVESRIAALPETATAADVDRIDAEFRSQLEAAEADVTSAREHAKTFERIERARANNPLIPRVDRFSISEPDLYQEDGPHSFISDLYRSERHSDRGATERLQRHREERLRNANAEQRAAWADTSFYPPIWMETAWVQARRQRRVAANLFQQAPLPPSGNTLEVPSYAGAAPAVAADVMSGDNQLVTSNAPSAASVLTAPVSVFAGYVDVPRRMIERSLPGLDRVLFDDLANDINKHVDYYTLYGTGSGISPVGVFNASNTLSVTFSDTLNVSNFYAHLNDAVQQIQTNAYENADAIIAHPRRIAWLLSQVDSEGRPLMVPAQNGAYNALGVIGSEASPFGQDDPQETAIRPSGWILNIPVYADANITTTAGAGTNQDELLVGAFRNAILWEDRQGIREFIFEGVASDHLNLRLQGVLYASFLVRFPQAFATISGSSLTPPTFGS